MKKAVAEYYWSLLPVSASNVLDLGCGTGDLGRYCPRSAKVHGLDADERAITVAMRSVSAQVWDLDLPKRLPFESDSFDAVVAKDILEHLQRPWQLLLEARRVLKPGGVLLASVICEFNRRTWSDYTHVRGFTEKAAVQLVTDAGFHVEGQWRMGGIPFSARWGFIHLNPLLLRVPPLHWFWTSSYEIRATKPD
jgi:2-polyprenyl-3-methyl-5-hydroxy-6-metoxy-1,4-benzoquinol methylase